MNKAGIRTCAAVAALLLSRGAAAEDAAARGFDPDPARPALGLDRGFVVETPAAAPKGALGAELLVDWAQGLLALRLGSDRTQLLASRLSAHLLAGYSFGRVELGVDLPVALWQRADLGALEARGVTGPLVAPVAATALGDLRLVAKLPLLDGARAPVAAAVLLDLRAPTGDAKAFTSDGPMAVPSVVVSRPLGPVRLDAQLGYAVRRAGQYAQLVVHDGLTWAAGASMDLPPLSGLTRWRAIAELAGGWPRGDGVDTDRYRAPLSARAGLRAALWRGLGVDLGGGAGLGAPGYGRESWRVFAGVRWDSTSDDGARGREGDGDPDGDTDGDGVANRLDLCPTDPGSAELDGCPDFDGDGIPDREDRCPKEPGPPQNEGCPVGEEPLVEIETEHLSLKDAINFDTGRDTIRRESSRVLDEIARILAQHPEIRRVRVEGHTDNVGGAAYNKDLSQRRAQAVVSALISRGIARERLDAVGYGFERPVTSNATALGRARNRRVEFTIMGEGGAPPGAPR